MNCIRCGKDFFIPFGEQPYKQCSSCRIYGRIETREHRQRKKTKRTKDTLDKILEEIEAYNKKYGTHYSYGQFIAARKYGWLKRDWSEFENGN